MKPKHQRLIFILFGLISLGTAAAVILNNFNDNLVFYYSPADLPHKTIKPGAVIRVGGLVEADSIQKLPDGLTTEFSLTDLTASITVRYKGMLPPMFREQQGTVAKGTLSDDVLIADSLLTKHDETYMPPEVAESLKKSGQWKGNAP